MKSKTGAIKQSATFRNRSDLDFNLCQLRHKIYIFVMKNGRLLFSLTFLEGQKNVYVYLGLGVTCIQVAK